jgi:hypothetical protein
MSPSNLFITHRRMQNSADLTHRHVGWVRLNNGRELSRLDVLALMQQGYMFYTLAASGHQAKVHKLTCRRCRTTYLTTSPDPWKDDNLDNLPSF